MRHIVGELVLGNEDRWWLQPRFLRRGRLVEHAVTLLAQGKRIEDEWWTRASGERDDDRVEHEECRPYVNGGAKFLREHRVNLLKAQLEVINPVLRYQGHIDWEMYFLDIPTNQVSRTSGIRGVPACFIIDLKNGKPPAPDSPLDIAYRYQLAGYALGYLAQYNIRCRRADLFLFEGDYRFVERTDRQDLADFHTLVQFYHLSRRWHREAD